jgi:hypothetical protein
MTIFASSAARFLVQAAAHDTLIVRQVPPVHTAFEQVVSIASGISTLLVLALVAGLVWAMLAVRASVRRAHEALDRRIAEFGKRLDDFNDLLGKVHRKADALVEVGGMAADGIKWGAQKMKERHAAHSGGDAGATEGDAGARGTSAARTAGATNPATEDRESPYLDAHDSGT